MDISIHTKNKIAETIFKAEFQHYIFPYAHCILFVQQEVTYPHSNF